MLTHSELVVWLGVRRSNGESLTAIGRELGVSRSNGESLTAIGRELGVSRQAVQQWLNGATQPSRLALILAEQLYDAPLEMAPGLPLGAKGN